MHIEIYIPVWGTLSPPPPTIAYITFPFFLSIAATRKKAPNQKSLPEQIFEAVLRDDKEQTPMAFAWARWVRVTCPPLYHVIMAQRAQKTVPQPEINQRY